MSKRKIATNIPSELLEEAVALTGLNQTSALVEGLKELIRREKRSAFLLMEGKIPIKLDIKKSRARG